jgi:hypothetical protein
MGASPTLNLAVKKKALGVRASGIPSSHGLMRHHAVPQVPSGIPGLKSWFLPHVPEGKLRP